MLECSSHVKHNSAFCRSESPRDSGDDQAWRPELAPRTTRRVAKRSRSWSALGERVRALRSRRGMTRKAVALAADVSERHLANLEYGIGNASILVLLQVARRCSARWPNCSAT